MKFTIEIYKLDQRKKEGKRLDQTIEIDVPTRNDAELVANAQTVKDPKKTYEVHQTYREVRHALSGELVKEHYKTPWSCSVASETYFCS